MQVFHLVPASYGLDDLQNRCMRVALISELNDPFELQSVDLSDANLRRGFQATKETIAKNRGLLCFS